MSARPVVPPTRTDGGLTPSSDGYKLEHPAFGQVTVGRVHGHAVLYGSDFEHNAYVEVRVSRSTLNRDLSRDWAFQRGELVSFMMSEAQWATFVSSFNIGAGVQCTLDHVMGEMMPSFPLEPRAEIFSKEVQERLTITAKRMSDYRHDIDAVLQGVSAKKKAEVLSILDKAEQDLRSNLPFVVQSFDEHVEKTVETAKVEIHAYLHHVVQRAGLEALGVQSPLQLEDKSDAEEVDPKDTSSDE